MLCLSSAQPLVIIIINIIIIIEQKWNF